MKLSVITITCVVLSACARESVAPEPESFDDHIAAAIEQAEAGGGGDAQLAILRKAQSEGALLIEDARAANRAAVECITDAGFLAFYAESTKRSGLVLPEYSYSADTEQQQATATACSTQEDFWVNMIYQTQPASLELTDGYRARQAPILRRCLESNGHATDPNASPEELIAQALEVDSDTSNAIDCISEAEIE